MQDILDHPRIVPLLIVGAGLAALLTALLAEAWGGLLPCILCIYQRYAYVIAVAFGLVGVAGGSLAGLRRIAILLAGLAFLSGAAIAVFHVGVEQHWWRGTPECHAPQFDPTLSIDEQREQLLASRFVPCDEIPWALFGLSMAAYNVLASTVLGLLCFYAVRRMSPARRSGEAEGEAP